MSCASSRGRSAPGSRRRRSCGARRAPVSARAAARPPGRAPAGPRHAAAPAGRSQAVCKGLGSPNPNRRTGRAHLSRRLTPMRKANMMSRYANQMGKNMRTMVCQMNMYRLVGVSCEPAGDARMRGPSARLRRAPDTQTRAERRAERMWRHAATQTHCTTADSEGLVAGPHWCVCTPMCQCTLDQHVRSS